MNTAEKVIVEGCRLWAPPPAITCSEWVDAYRYLSSESSAEHGKAKCLSFQRGPLDAISDPRIARVVIKSCTQLLKTFAIESAIGYFSHVDPGPILVLQPGGEDARDFSKERIGPMIRDTPVLRKLFSESKGRSKDNTITEKIFPGGILAIAGAGSERNVARRSIRILLCDEIDKYEASKEGNVVPLARKRLTTFRHRAKEVDTCSPTLPNSEIDKAYQASDQREYYVPCPLCGHMQSMMLKFHKQVRWQPGGTFEEQAGSARYHCEACNQPWDDAMRMKAVEAGEWRANAPFQGIAGFWISELYSPWVRLSQMVLDFLTKRGDIEDLRTFVNTSLAENWEDKGEAPEWQILLDRREKDFTAGVVPQGGLFVTIGADVHPDRIEAEAVAWGRDKQSWSLAYEIFNGRPSEPEVWTQFEAFTQRLFPHGPSGQMLAARRVFVDSGDSTNDVYTWVRTQDADLVVAIKGYEGGASPVGQPSAVDVMVNGRKVKDGLKIKTVQVSFFKSGLYSDLKKRPPTAEEQEQGLTFPPGYCHFPLDAKNYGDEHFKQICAEQKVARKNPRTGRTVVEWQQTRDRNEALDCRVYARAAAWDFGMDQAQPVHWEQLEESLKPPAPPPKPAEPVPTTPREHPREIETRQAEKAAEAEQAVQRTARWEDKDHPPRGGYIERRTDWFRRR